MFRFFFLLSLLSNIQSLTASEPRELVIYANDSFNAQGGIGPVILPLFEKKCGCRVRVLSSGNSVQLLNRLAVDAKRKKPTAHLVVGLDQNLWEQIQDYVESWGSWVPSGYRDLDRSFTIGKNFLPYDYGILAFIADRQLMKEMKLRDLPVTLSDLLKPEWKRNILIEDPRTSTPGLMMLLYSQNIYDTEVWKFWKQFKSQWLTMTPGWSAAYRLFLKKEAPLVWSYVSSQAYHEENGDTGPHPRYQAVLFKEGQPYQVEGAAWIKGAAQTSEEKRWVREFLEFLLSPEVQALIPKTLWMMPVRKGTPLPPSFKKLPQPTRLIPVSMKTQEIRDTLSQWNQAIGF